MVELWEIAVDTLLALGFAMELDLDIWVDLLFKDTAPDAVLGEEAIQRALEEYREGRASSLRRASTALAVPRSTVTHRAAGRQSLRDAHTKCQALTVTQEETLCRYLREAESWDFLPCKRDGTIAL